MSAVSLSDAPLLAEIRELIDSARQRAATAVNAELTLLYWRIGRRINAEVLGGQRAEYGAGVVKRLAGALTREYGRGWSERQLRYCLRAAEAFPDERILHTLCSELSWSHLRTLILIDDPDLKIGAFEAGYNGQMELYLRHLEAHERVDGEDTPIGLILCTGKNEEPPSQSTRTYDQVTRRNSR